MSFAWQIFPPTTHPITLRNSRAGPHKCGRINPSTSKPCNSIFSQPHDLKHHEDTIHKSRNQRIRCHLCTEEKTSSRNDMRVVHPDVCLARQDKEERECSDRGRVDTAKGKTAASYRMSGE